MADPVTIAALAITTGLGAGASALGAAQQNRANRRAADSARTSAIVQERQVADQAGLERRKQEIAAERARGRLRVIASESGSGFEDAFDSLVRQNETDLSINRAIMDANQQSQAAAIRAGYAGTLANLRARFQNLLLSGLQGGLQGAATGLQIAGGINSVGGAGGSGGAGAGTRVDTLPQPNYPVPTRYA